MTLKSVVLPAPFGPITLTISPLFTVRSRSWRTVRPPNASVTPLSSSIRRFRQPAPARQHAVNAARPRGRRDCVDGEAQTGRRGDDDREPPPAPAAPAP